MTRVLVAFDAFKGTLDQVRACAAFSRGLNSVRSDIAVRACPIADGGEGTRLVLEGAGAGESGGDLDLLLLEDGSALIESAAFIGLDRCPRGPLAHDSAPLGEQVRLAALSKTKSLHIALGGSGTVDGGLGLLRALGAVFLRGNERFLPTVEQLGEVTQVYLDDARQSLEGMSLTGWVDVDVPLSGAGMFFAQKGLHKKAAARHLEALLQFGRRLPRPFGGHVVDEPGAGAAGGLGAAVVALGGVLVPGAQEVLSRLDFAAHLAAADVVVTGEGRFDAQSAHKKGPGVVLGLARAAHTPCVLVAGEIEGNPGADAVFSLVKETKNPRQRPEPALEEAGKWLAKALSGGLFDRA